MVDKFVGEESAHVLGLLERLKYFNALTNQTSVFTVEINIRYLHELLDQARHVIRKREGVDQIMVFLRSLIDQFGLKFGDDALITNHRYIVRVFQTIENKLYQ